MTLPVIKTQPTAQAVVDEHLDAINKCDWNRLMAQYPDNVEFFLPKGEVVRGRAAVGDEADPRRRRLHRDREPGDAAVRVREPDRPVPSGRQAAAGD